MFRISKQVTLIATLALVAGFVSTANAAVIYDTSVNFTTSADPNTIVRQDTYTFDNATDLGGFDPTGSDKLVVAFGAENANGIDSIQYGNVELKEALVYDNAIDLYVYYLDNPTVNGNLFINPTGSNVNGVGGTIFALSGTGDDFGQTSASSAASTSIGVDADSLIVAIGVRNQGTPPDASSPLVETFSSGSGSSATGVGYQSVTTAGTLTPTFTNSAAFVGAVEFVIPEPASLMLVGVGSMLILGRRRRDARG